MGNLKELDESTFDKEINESKIPVLVDFGAEWCGPCRAIAPIVEELATGYQGKVTFARVDVDKNSRVASKFSIHSIPTILIFKAGKPVKQAVGFRQKADLKKMIDEVIK